MHVSISNVRCAQGSHPRASSGSISLLRHIRRERTASSRVRLLDVHTFTTEDCLGIVIPHREMCPWANQSWRMLLFLVNRKGGLGIRKVMVCDLGHSHLDVTILEEQEVGYNHRSRPFLAPLKYSLHTGGGNPAPLGHTKPHGFCMCAYNRAS